MGLLNVFLPKDPAAVADGTVEVTTEPYGRDKVVITTRRGGKVRKVLATVFSESEAANINEARENVLRQEAEHVD